MISPLTWGSGNSSEPNGWQNYASAIPGTRQRNKRHSNAVPHGLRHCHSNDGEKMGRDQQANGVGGCPPKVKAAQEAGPAVARTMVGEKNYA